MKKFRLKDYDKFFKFGDKYITMMKYIFYMGIIAILFIAIAEISCYISVSDVFIKALPIENIIDKAFFTFMFLCLLEFFMIVLLIIIFFIFYIVKCIKRKQKEKNI